MNASIENAWQIHSAQMDWTGKVDAKAGFAVALDSAAIATLVALSGQNMIFANMGDTWAWLPYWASVVLFIVGGFLALWAVAPSLRWRQMKAERQENFVFFGHAKGWQPEFLDAALRTDDVSLVLSRQIVAMAGIAWKKHLKVGWSLWLIGAGVLSLFIAALISANSSGQPYP
ncbi:Pycsar system effector family protein [Kocuria sp. M1R5S2]|uniref:Pycsar system effector family protein n=1 Tax=Kocuria rhizosphaerae TaxID=3376285 RepID=UPI0037A2E13B